MGLLMFAQYFVWGAWWVTLGAWLAAGPFEDIVGATYATQGYAAVLSPMIFGALADRRVPAARLLGVLHLCGAAALAHLATIEVGHARLIGSVLLVMLLYMPTIPLSNIVVMAALADSTRQFPPIRALGTIGWIAAGLLIGFGPDLMGMAGLAASGPLEPTTTPILLAAGAAALLGLYCFTLPSPPPAQGPAGAGLMALIGFDFALSVRDRGFWVFIACSTLIVVPLSFYYAYANSFLIATGLPRAAAVQSLGQVSEILFMLLLPAAFARLGIRWVLLIGMAAWVLRYALFAFGLASGGPVVWMLLAGILLHGICYDFFFVAGQVHVDRLFPPETRGRAQAFLAFMTLGVGTIIGANFANLVAAASAQPDGSPDWFALWMVPAIIAGLVALLYAVLTRARGPAAAEIA
ncbi:MFS transporter [Erythrobacter sp. NE805]|uniref:MFS transporter n=1 Tax=Erythrobacter sp. NE805 TaxID=3389875 RepID=UPI00396B185A